MLAEEQYPFPQSCAKRIQYLSCHRITENCSQTMDFCDALIIASEEADSSEILVPICQATQCRIPEEYIL